MTGVDDDGIVDADVCCMNVQAVLSWNRADYGAPEG